MLANKWSRTTAKALLGIAVFVTVSGTAFADSDQPIVVVCAAENYNPGVRISLTINLASGTVSIENADPYFTTTSQATVTQASDQKVTFETSGERGSTFSLDRYTGHMTFTTRMNGNKFEANCQRTQKQF